MIIKTPAKGILPPDNGEAEGVMCEEYAIVSLATELKQIKPAGQLVRVFHFGTGKIKGGSLYVTTDTGVILHPLGG